MNYLASLLRRNSRRRSYADLLELDDRLLADIGLSRSGLIDLMNSRAPRSVRHG